MCVGFRGQLLLIGCIVNLPGPATFVPSRAFLDLASTMPCSCNPGAAGVDCYLKDSTRLVQVWHRVYDSKPGNADCGFPRAGQESLKVRFGSQRDHVDVGMV